MNAIIEKVDVSVTTRMNSLPTSKAALGRFRLSEGLDAASFEETGVAELLGESRSRRVFRKENASIWWNADKRRYRVCISVSCDPLSAMQGEWDAEECMNILRRRISNGTDL